MDNRTRAWIRALRHEIDVIEGTLQNTTEEWRKLVDSFDPQEKHKVIEEKELI